MDDEQGIQKRSFVARLQMNLQTCVPEALKMHFERHLEKPIEMFLEVALERGHYVAESSDASGDACCEAFQETLLAARLRSSLKKRLERFLRHVSSVSGVMIVNARLELGWSEESYELICFWSPKTFLEQVVELTDEPTFWMIILAPFGA